MTDPKHDDGGPAYPLAAPSPLVDGKGERTGEWRWEDEGIVEGMTLLDHFAGEAMAGRMAALASQDVVRARAAAAADCGLTVTEADAVCSYDTAAAMIAEKRRREKEHDDG